MGKDEMIGRRLANYQIQRLLGRGGMASVYFAQDVKLKRPVAIKMIDTRFQGDPVYAKRFVDEARMVATWRHENVIQVYYADYEDQIYYFAMEYIEGISLEDLISDYAKSGELMSHEDVIKIGRAIASALDYAHRKGVIHRDVKPANAMIGYDDRVVLTDFGLALDTARGTMGEVFGTPHYISPEQARSSADAVPQSDIYSLGVMLYEMLTGAVPFDDPSAATLALQHLSAPPPRPRSVNPALSQPVEDVLLKVLEKEPDARYQSGTALMDALEAAINMQAAPPQEDDDLPLPPAHVNRAKPLMVSRMSVSEKVALNLETLPPPDLMTAPHRTIKASAKTRRSESVVMPDTRSKPNYTLMGIGALVVVVIAGIIGVVLSGAGDDNTQALPTLMENDNAAVVVTEPESTQTSDQVMPTTVVVVSSDTPVPTEVPATGVPAPTETALPTTTPIPPTDTPAPTQVPPTSTPLPTQVPPTSTPLPTQVPPTSTLPPTIPPEPTILFPDGRRVTFLYNESSFYISNATGASIRIGSIDFEAFDSTGTALYAFDGGLWTRFYHSVENNKCLAIEITDAADWMRPAQCRDYNSVVTVMASADTVFWTIRPGSVGFRVLWNNQEIARCPIGTGTCETYLP